jgi:hypothetical protein
MRTVLLACLFSLTLSAAHAQDVKPLVQRTALSGKVSLLVPEDFGPLKPEIMDVKYRQVGRPTEVLSNERGTINIAFGHTQNAITPAQIRQAYPAMERQIKATYPTARWNRSEMVEREGRSYFLLDFWAPAADTEIRNIMLGTSVDGRFLLVSFNVTSDLEKEWGPIGTRIMDSVRVIE